MAHNKLDVISTRNELLRLIAKQRDIYTGAIANLDNTKRMLLMVHDGMDADTTMEPPLDLSGEPPPITPDDAKPSRIRALAEKISAAGNGA